ncbi:helix-turn-helix transcriptional regulator [Paenibacillus kobensis]|uniref:helix-turn-helix transcriptional regulator n=1 Tax=Paenibacillus kobensis TaxID=59841 RepID=UPI000FD8EEC7|nr:AraC family transcriptional regulator [Paenibacillus kobensis]
MNTIRYVGCNSAHSGDFVYDFPEGHDFWLLIITQTPAAFWVQGEVKDYPANCAVLYPPRHKIYYRACSDQFIDDWVRFDSTESYVTETAFPLGLPIPVPDPGYCHQLFQLLAVENFLSCDYREHSIDYLFRLLFNKLLEASSAKDNSPHDHILLDLRKAVYTNPGNPWTVAAMADYVLLSPGYLQALYKSRFGISCMDDVIQCRIRLAKEKLLYGHLRIADIGTLCGYKNVEHFSRQFRQIVGCTPREFRKSAST